MSGSVGAGESRGDLGARHAHVGQDHGHASAVLDLEGDRRRRVVGQLDRGQAQAVVALGRLFRTFSDNFQFPEFWALTIILFVFALVFSSAIGWLEHKVEYYAGSRI